MSSHPRTGLIALAALAALSAPPARAFCGFYVAKADAKLFNQASQVALVRDGERTVLTMSNDYQGELSQFALVVPVPSVIQKEQVHIGEQKLLERLDAYSGPRLVEYHDSDPCAPMIQYAPMALAKGATAAAEGRAERARALGVTIEAQYTVGEYEIVILSAKQSDGLEIWLRESGYKIPPSTAKALAPYIRQEMKFFVAKVDLTEQKKTGFQTLRPIQIAYESPRFLLPIRLGMANSSGPQDLIVYTLTRKGRVESTNYRTEKIPSDLEVPLAVKGVFGEFYKAVFARALAKANGRSIFTEYFWDMGWCDPCAADPLSPEELRALGVYWLDDGAQAGPKRPRPWGGGGAVPVVLTRLHVRYDDAHFPEDLMFQETGDRQNFQARYVMRHPFQGSLSCEAGERYRQELRQRNASYREVLASVTGWSAERVQGMVPADPQSEGKKEEWWKKLWK